MFQKADDPVRLAVDLVNSWDVLEDDPELMKDPATLQRFLLRRGHGRFRTNTQDLAEVRAVRDALREAFSAKTEAEAVRLLNRIVARSGAKPQLERSGDRWRVRWVGPLADTVASATSMSLLEAIRDDGWERFGMCAGAPCCCVFVDRSKNRSRRFCSDLCSDRVAQAALRSRRRAAR
jgi:predicted RNA-binding Zn ribbon-like protein